MVAPCLEFLSLSPGGKASRAAKESLSTNLLKRLLLRIMNNPKGLGDYL
jgi:hypothetical protein